MKKQMLILGLLIAGVANAADLNQLSQADGDLFYAVERGDAQRVKDLIEKEGAHVEARDFHDDSYDMTPLMLACRHNKFEVAKVLVEHGAEVNARMVDGLTSLLWACDCEGGVEAAPIVEYLLAHGADPAGRDSCGRCPLMSAAKFGFAATLDLLLARMSDVDRQDATRRTALIYALENHANGYEAIVHRLIGHGANVNLGDDDGRTPLMLAKDEEIVRLLLARGAIVDSAPKGIKFTAFAHNILRGNLPIAKLLIAAGANPFACLETGLRRITVLTWAKKYSHVPACKDTIAYLTGLYDRRAVLCALEAHYELLPEADRFGSFEDFPPDVTWMVLKPILAATEVTE